METLVPDLLAFFYIYFTVHHEYMVYYNMPNIAAVVAKLVQFVDSASISTFCLSRETVGKYGYGKRCTLCSQTLESVSVTAVDKFISTYN